MPAKKYATEEEKREAKNITNKLYYERNKAKISEKNKVLYKENISELKIKMLSYRVKNKEKAKNKSKKWRLENPEKAIKARNSWRGKNKNKVNESNKKWRDKNKERSNFISSEWAKKNRHLTRIYCSRRRHYEIEIGQKIDKYLSIKVYEKFNNKCFNCNSENKLELDHHYPLSLGNPLTINNTVLLCRSCNSKKAAKLPESFYTPEQLLDLEKNYGISKQSQNFVEQPSLFETRMSKNLELDFGKVQAMNAV